MRRAILGLVVAGVLLGAGGAPVGAQQGAVPPGGEKLISLDLKGLDILDVLKLLSQQSNLSFIAGRNVTGRVTLFVKDVPLWDAFELIVAANDLAYERRETIINVMTGRDYELLYGEKFQDPKAVEAIALKYAKAVTVATVLNQVKSNVGRVIVDEPSNTVILLDLPAKVEQMRTLIQKLDAQTKTFVWEMQYGKVKDVQEKVQQALTPNVGTLQIDERTNKLIVTDSPSVIEQIDGMVRAFDTKTRQVLIEAKIVQVTLSDKYTMGIDWTTVRRNLDSDLRGNFDALGDILGGAAKGFTLKYRAGGMAITALLELIQTYGKTDIISSPSITVTDSEEAKILIGTKEAFVTTTVVTPGTGPTTTAEQVTFVDVGVNLTVTPTIKPDGFVQLKIRPEVSSVERELKTSQGNTIPIVKTSEAETHVLLKSGTTIIIGGLIEDRVETSQDKIPLLGDIPLLKYAFRSNVDTMKKTETIIFLTPYVVSGDEPLLQMADVQARSPAATELLGVMPTTFELTPGQVPASYRESVWRHLKTMLRSAYRGRVAPGTATTVTFRLQRDGSLVGEPVVTGAADPAFVQQTVEAVKAGAPFPSFPPEMRLSEAQFRVAVEYGAQ